MEIVFKNSSRVKGIKISIRPGGLVLVTKPFFVSKKMAEKLLRQKKDWIEKAVQKQLEVKSLKSDRRDYLKNKNNSKKIITAKVEELNQFYNFSYNKVFIKNQSSRWGSCSSLKNLSFNWQVANLSDELLTYIVAHELCHLRELNHSHKFWLLVSKLVPNYKNLRKKLLKEGVNLI